jgi:NAD(P)-dependent dehydrogenase (short-subunit alcohol dehydrogenase family)
MAESAGPLQQRVAIVTGGSRGIGAAVAKGLAAAGAKVLVTSRTKGGCDSVVASIREDGGEAIEAVADLIDPGAADRVVQRTLDEWGGLHVLINNAGLLRPHFVQRISMDELDQLLAVNFRGPFSFCLAALPHLQVDGGSIVNMSALSAVRGQSGMGAYASSKAAMLAMTRTMAREWGPLGVRVNAVVPGAVATDMIMPRDPEAHQSFLDEMGAKVALGRIATPDDLVGPTVFLAGPASSYVTGQALFVDGGAFD